VVPVKASPPLKPAKEFPPSVTEGKLSLASSKETDKRYDIAGGTIACLTKDGAWNVHGRHVVDVA
jgi:hypothetical protein